jgi:hypothetical protein
MPDADSKAKPSRSSRPTVADAIADARTSLRLLRAILSRLLRGIIGGVLSTSRTTDDTFNQKRGVDCGPAGGKPAP